MNYDLIFPLSLLPNTLRLLCESSQLLQPVSFFKARTAASFISHGGFCSHSLPPLLPSLPAVESLYQILYKQKINYNVINKDTCHLSKASHRLEKTAKWSLSVCGGESTSLFRFRKTVKTFLAIRTLLQNLEALERQSLSSFKVMHKVPITNKRIHASLQNLHLHQLTPTDFYCFQCTTYFSVWTCGKKIHLFLKKNITGASQSLFCSYNKIIKLHRMSHLQTFVQLENMGNYLTYIFFNLLKTFLTKLSIKMRF